MAVSKKLMEILVCPFCKGDLEEKTDRPALKCLSCRRVYPVRNDIPVMLIEEAVIEE